MQEIHKRYGGCPISVIQNPYNLLNRSAEEELFPAAAYGRLGVMAYSPLGAGLLGGAFADGRPAPEKSTWGYDPPFYRYCSHTMFPNLWAFPHRHFYILAKKLEIIENQFYNLHTPTNSIPCSAQTMASGCLDFCMLSK